MAHCVTHCATRCACLVVGGDEGALGRRRHREHGPDGIAGGWLPCRHRVHAAAWGGSSRKTSACRWAMSSLRSSATGSNSYGSQGSPAQALPPTSRKRTGVPRTCAMRFSSKICAVYCSTVSGASDIPLATYITPSGAAQQIAMRSGTPHYPRRPAMVVYDRLSTRIGIGFVVPGVYVHDILVSAQASGARSALVVATDGSALTQRRAVSGRCFAWQGLGALRRGRTRFFRSMG